MSHLLDRISDGLGSVAGVVITALILLTDLALGYQTGWSNGWSSANGAATGLASILLLSVVLHVENRGSAALQAKLDAIVKATAGVPDELVGAEKLPVATIASLRESALEQVKGAVEEAVDDANGTDHAPSS